MKNFEKYERSYFMPPVPCYDWVKKDHIEKPPVWCSVDLRDGNQALIEPMSLEEKIEFFQMLLDVGFKQIEVGFPAASATEYQFLRTLIEQNMIPEDVTIQVLTQAREHIIKRTFEAVKGAPHAVIHLYNSTSVAQREQVFKKNKEEIKKIAVDGAILLNELAKETEGNFTFEYSPESFQGTEVDYALEVCNAVLRVWEPVSYTHLDVYKRQVQYQCIRRDGNGGLWGLHKGGRVRFSAHQQLYYGTDDICRTESGLSLIHI